MVNMKVESSLSNSTGFGGMKQAFCFAKRLGVFGKLGQHVQIERRQRTYENRQYFETLVVMLMAGYRKMKHVVYLAQDQLVLCLLDLDTLPHASTLGRFLKRSTFKSCQQIIDVRRAVSKKVYRRYRKPTQYTVDIDSSVSEVYGHPEGAQKGYNPARKGGRCYHPIFAFLYETKELVHGYLRPGDVHTSHGSVEFLKELLSHLPDRLRQLFVRADSGFYADDILAFCEEANVKYVVKARLYAPLLAKLCAIRTQAWSEFEPGVEITAFHFRHRNWKRRRKFVVTRKAKPNHSRQLRLLEEPDYEYQLYVTNLHWEAAPIVRFYRKRGTAENYIKETKYDMGLGKLLTDSFWANEAIFQLTLLSYNLLVWFKRFILEGGFKQMTIQVFRRLYMYVPGVLTKHAGQRILKLPKHAAAKEPMLLAQARLAQL